MNATQTTKTQPTTTYVIYLCGSSNSYNKAMNNGDEPVAVVDGSGATAAQRRAAAIEAAGVTTYNGQYLRARPLSRCSQADIDAARENEMAAEGQAAADAAFLAEMAACEPRSVDL